MTRLFSFRWSLGRDVYIILISNGIQNSHTGSWNANEMIQRIQQIQRSHKDVGEKGMHYTQNKSCTFLKKLNYQKNVRKYENK